MGNNTIHLHLVKNRVARNNGLYQYDYGRRIVFSGVELPSEYEVHFSNTGIGSAKTQIGNETGVNIPDEYLLSGEPVYLWIFLHDGENDGRTEYAGIISVEKKAQPSDQPPTPVQQDIITETISALNVAVTRAEAIAEEIPQTINDALLAAKESGDFDGADGKDGQDGYTPVKNVDYFDGEPGRDGLPGTDGYSPTVNVSKTGKVVTITVTDKTGTKTETIEDGEDADPTVLIDDTAGSGETQKTWSADKIQAMVGDIETLLSAI